MALFDVDDDMTEPQKSAFVLRWERIRHRGIGLYLLRMVAGVTLMLGFYTLISPTSDSINNDTVYSFGEWASQLSEYTLQDIAGFCLWASLIGLASGVLTWFGGEELYRNFKI